MEKSNKIAIIAVIVSIISASFAGLDYISNEVSKRSNLSVLIQDKQYWTTDYDYTFPSTGYNYTLTIYLKITGIITNEGSRNCTIGDMFILFGMPASEALLKKYGITNLKVGDTVGLLGRNNGTTWNDIGLSNNIINQGESRTFTITINEIADDYYKKLPSFPILFCNFKIYYDDDLGLQSYEKTIEDFSPTLTSTIKWTATNGTN